MKPIADAALLTLQTKSLQLLAHVEQVVAQSDRRAA